MKKLKKSVKIILVACVSLVCVAAIVLGCVFGLKDKDGYPYGFTSAQSALMSSINTQSEKDYELNDKQMKSIDLDMLTDESGKKISLEDITYANEKYFISRNADYFDLHYFTGNQKSTVLDFISELERQELIQDYLHAYVLQVEGDYVAYSYNYLSEETEYQTIEIAYVPSLDNIVIVNSFTFFCYEDNLYYDDECVADFDFEFFENYYYYFYQLVDADNNVNSVFDVFTYTTTPATDDVNKYSYSSDDIDDFKSSENGLYIVHANTTTDKFIYSYNGQICNIDIQNSVRTLADCYMTNQGIIIETGVIVDFANIKSTTVKVNTGNTAYYVNYSYKFYSFEKLELISFPLSAGYSKIYTQSNSTNETYFYVYEMKVDNDNLLTENGKITYYDKNLNSIISYYVDGFSVIRYSSGDAFVTDEGIHKYNTKTSKVELIYDFKTETNNYSIRTNNINSDYVLIFGYEETYFNVLSISKAKFLGDKYQFMMMQDYGDGIFIASDNESYYSVDANLNKVSKIDNFHYDQSGINIHLVSYGFGYYAVENEDDTYSIVDIKTSETVASNIDDYSYGYNNTLFKLTYEESDVQKLMLYCTEYSNSLVPMKYLAPPIVDDDESEEQTEDLFADSELSSLSGTNWTITGSGTRYIHIKATSSKYASSAKIYLSNVGTNHYISLSASVSSGTISAGSASSDDWSELVTNAVATDSNVSSSVSTGVTISASSSYVSIYIYTSSYYWRTFESASVTLSDLPSSSYDWVGPSSDTVYSSSISSSSYQTNVYSTIIGGASRNGGLGPYASTLSGDVDQTSTLTFTTPDGTFSPDTTYLRYGAGNGNGYFGKTWYYYQLYEPISYTISYTLNSGTAGSSAPTSGTYGSGVVISNPTRSYYTFTGWTITGLDSYTHYYGSSASSNSTSTSTSLSSIKDTWFKNLRSSTGTVTFTANWVGNQYSITYNLNDISSTQTPAYGTYYPSSGIYDTGLTISNPTMTGYTFTGWTITGMNSCTHYYGSSSSSYSTSTATSLSSIKSTWFKNLHSSTTGAVTFTANWSAISYKVTYPTSYTETTTDTVYYDNVINIPAITREFYTFSGYSISGCDSTTHYYGSTSSVSSSSTSTSFSVGSSNVYFKNFTSVAGNTITVTAKWTGNQYNLTMKANGGTFNMSSAYSNGFTNVSAATNDTLCKLTRTTVGSYFYKYNSYAAYYAVAYISDIDKTGPLLVSKTASAVSYIYTQYIWYAEYEVTTCNSLTYNGETWYYCVTDGWVSGSKSDTGGYGAPRITASTITTAVKNIIDNYQSTGYKTALYGTTYSFLNPTRTGYTFNGWTITGMDTVTTHTFKGTTTTTSTSSTATLDGTYTTYANLRGSSGTVVCTARWLVNSYDITYSLGDGAWVGTETYATSGTYDQVVYIQNVAQDGWPLGYYFNGWTISGCSGTVYYGTTSSPSSTKTSSSFTLGKSYVYFKNLTNVDGAKITFTAVWVPYSYNIQYVANGENVTLSSSSATSASYDSTFYAYHPTRIGYTFAGWALTNLSDDITHKANGTSFTSTNGAYMEADNPNNYNLIYRSSYTYSTFYNLHYVNGATVTLTAYWTPNTYTVTYYYSDDTCWSSDPTLTQLNTTSNMSLTKTQSVVYDQYFTTYAVSAAENSNTVTVPTGYKMKGWYISTTSISNSVTTSLTTSFIVGTDTEVLYGYAFATAHSSSTITVGNLYAYAVYEAVSVKLAWLAPTSSSNANDFSKYSIIKYTNVSYGSSFTIPTSVNSVSFDYYMISTNYYVAGAPFNSETSYTYGGYSYTTYAGETIPFGISNMKAKDPDNPVYFAYGVVDADAYLRKLVFTYSSSLGGYSVSARSTSIYGKVIIPSTYNDGTHGELKVLEVASSAFYGCKNITSVEFKGNVKTIGTYAFRGCTKLTSVTIPNTVTTMSSYVFYGCTALTYLYIPSSVTSMSSYIVWGCTSVTVYCQASSRPSGWATYWNARTNSPITYVTTYWGQ